MAVYIIATVLSALFSVLAYLSQKSVSAGTLAPQGVSLATHKVYYGSYRFFIFLSLLPLFVISAIRYNVGTDYMHIYVQCFLQVLHGYMNPHFEIGFLLLNKLATLFTANYIGIFVISSAIFILFTYWSIFEQSENPTISIILLLVTFYYFASLNTLRQYMAIALTTFALRYIKRKKLIPYLICIAIAFTLHSSALIMLPVYWIANFKISLKKAVALFGALIALQSVISILMNTFVSLTSYAAYFNSKYDTATWNKLKPYYIAINLSLLVIFYIYYKKSSYNKNLSLFINIQIIATILSIFLGTVPLLDRILSYFSFVQIISIPNVILSGKSKFVRRLLLIVIIVCLGVYMFYGFSRNWDNVNPYQTIFSLR